MKTYILLILLFISNLGHAIPVNGPVAAQIPDALRDALNPILQNLSPSERARCNEQLSDLGVDTLRTLASQITGNAIGTAINATRAIRAGIRLPEACTPDNQYFTPRSEIAQEIEDKLGTLDCSQLKAINIEDEINKIFQKHWTGNLDNLPLTTEQKRLLAGRENPKEIIHMVLKNRAEYTIEKIVFNAWRGNLGRPAYESLTGSANRDRLESDVINPIRELFNRMRVDSSSPINNILQELGDQDDIIQLNENDEWILSQVISWQNSGNSFYRDGLSQTIHSEILGVLRSRYVNTGASENGSIFSDREDLRRIIEADIRQNGRKLSDLENLFGANGNREEEKWSEFQMFANEVMQTLSLARAQLENYIDEACVGNNRSEIITCGLDLAGLPNANENTQYMINALGAFFSLGEEAFGPQDLPEWRYYRPYMNVAGVRANTAICSSDDYNNQIITIPEGIQNLPESLAFTGNQSATSLWFLDCNDGNTTIRRPVNNNQNNWDTFGPNALTNGSLEIPMQQTPLTFTIADENGDNGQEYSVVYSDNSYNRNNIEVVPTSSVQDSLKVVPISEFPEVFTGNNGEISSHSELNRINELIHNTVPRNLKMDSRNYFAPTSTTTGSEEGTSTRNSITSLNDSSFSSPIRLTGNVSCSLTNNSFRNGDENLEIANADCVSSQPNPPTMEEETKDCNGERIPVANDCPESPTYDSGSPNCDTATSNCDGNGGIGLDANDDSDDDGTPVTTTVDDDEEPTSTPDQDDNGGGSTVNAVGGGQTNDTTDSGGPTGSYEDINPINVTGGEEIIDGGPTTNTEPVNSPTDGLNVTAGNNPSQCEPSATPTTSAEIEGESGQDSLPTLFSDNLSSARVSVARHQIQSASGEGETPEVTNHYHFYEFSRQANSDLLNTSLNGNAEIQINGNRCTVLENETPSEIEHNYASVFNASNEALPPETQTALQSTSASPLCLGFKGPNGAIKLFFRKPISEPNPATINEAPGVRVSFNNFSSGAADSEAFTCSYDIEGVNLGDQTPEVDNSNGSVACSNGITTQVQNFSLQEGEIMHWIDLPLHRYAEFESLVHGSLSDPPNTNALRELNGYVNDPRYNATIGSSPRCSANVCRPNPQGNTVPIPVIVRAGENNRYEFVKDVYQTIGESGGSVNLCPMPGATDTNGNPMGPGRGVTFKNVPCQENPGLCYGGRSNVWTLGLR